MRDWLRDMRDQAVNTAVDALGIAAFVCIAYVALFVWAGGGR